MTETTNPPTELPKVQALAAPVIDVPTPGGWVIIVRPADARRFPGQEGKLCAEFWEAVEGRPNEETEIGDVMELPPPVDPAAIQAEADEIMKHHHDVEDPGSGGPAFYETMVAAAAAAVSASRDRGAILSNALCDYIFVLAREADALREGLPVWGDVVFKRDVLEAVRAIRGKEARVEFTETDENRRQVHVDLVYADEHYEVSYEPDGEHDQERQDTILTCIKQLPARAAADRAATAG